MFNNKYTNMKDQVKMVSLYYFIALSMRLNVFSVFPVLAFFLKYKMVVAMTKTILTEDIMTASE
jgi:hypothetical protein